MQGNPDLKHAWGVLRSGSGGCSLWGSKSEPQEAGHLEFPGPGHLQRVGPTSAPVAGALAIQMREPVLLRASGCGGGEQDLAHQTVHPGPAWEQSPRY